MRIEPPPEHAPTLNDALRPWLARVRDAWEFGERTAPPIVLGKDILHRSVLLAIVAGLTAVFLALLAVPGVGILGKAVGNLSKRFEGQPVESAELPRIAQRSVVVDRKGKTIATLAGEENRVFVPLSDVPEQTQQAVLAIEDAQFYEHNGVDVRGLVRALLLNVRAGALRQGGSTITQQLVKNTIVGTERSIDRKIREARLAVSLERTKTKSEILELYLNETYFGNGVYGIGTAAEYYFGKRVSKLTLPESALLAGVIKAPQNYEPIANPDRARRRRGLVLSRMVDERMITEAQARAARNAPLGAKPHRLRPSKVPYFVEYVKGLLLEDKRFGATRSERAAALFQAGLRIETTLDLDLQNGARRATEAVLDRKNDPDSALVSIDPTTGAVRAMVGGRDFDKEKYNLAVQGKRQPGSTFKPFTMVAALAEGIPPGTTFDTPSPLKVKDSTGEVVEIANYSERGEGLMDMRRATEQSVNTYYVQLIQKVGPAKVVETAERMGITSELKPYISLALGTLEVSPFELASAYGTLANGGTYCKPFAIARVVDATGETVLRNAPSCERRISASVAAQATDILRGVPLRGTGTQNGRIGRPNAAKTGTTDRYTDSWYAGFTPQYATVVWLGYAESNKRELKNVHGLPRVFGGSLPAMIWSRYMRYAHRNLPVKEFPKPPKAASTVVPDVKGKTVEEAKRILEEARFTVRVETESSGKPVGTVLSQDPGGGGEVEKGSLVTLTISGDPEATSSPSPSPAPKKKKTGG